MAIASVTSAARSTRQRSAVAAMLNELEDFHTAQDIHDGVTAYRRCSPAHHHHLVCRNCGRTIEVDGPAVERWAKNISAAHGFLAVEHKVEVIGTCPDCQVR
jgi:Fur family ferric uptake transcriptional regulator